MDIFRRYFDSEDDNDDGDKNNASHNDLPKRKWSGTVLEARALKVEYIEINHEITTSPNASFSRDNQYLITYSTGGRVTIRDMETLNPIKTYSGWFNGQLLPDNEHIVMNANGGVLSVRHIATDEIVHEVKTTLEQPTNGDKRLVLLDPHACPHANRAFVVYRPELAMERERLFVRQEPCYVQIWDIDKRQKIRQIDNLAPVNAIGKSKPYYLSPDGTLVALVMKDVEVLRIVDTATGDTLIDIPENAKNLSLGREKKIVFSGDNQYVGFQKHKSYVMRSVKTGEEVGTPYERVSNNSKLFGFSVAHTIYVYDTQASPPKLVDSLSGDVIELPPYLQKSGQFIAISPDGNYLATANKGGLILYYIPTGDYLVYRNEALNNNLLDFSPDGQYLIVHPQFRDHIGYLFAIYPPSL